MPPSGRKGKTRARKAPAAEPQEPSDVETPEAIPTPSRSSRKRARESEAVPAPAGRTRRRKTKDTRGMDREDTEGTEAQEQSDNETEVASPTELEIIQHLKVADRQVNATEDYSNDLLEGQENVPGYGKIAGRDWTFIIRKVEVNIGRPEAHERLTGNGDGGPSARTLVDIDLGPDRQVSRSHAIIGYDSEHMQWFVVVNGRNGLRVDNNVLKRGAKAYLRNGCVIEIANTQMAFVTTATEDSEGPVWDASIVKQAQKSSEDDDEGEDNIRPGTSRPHAHPGGRAQMPAESGAYTSGDYAGSQNRTHPHSQRAMDMGPGTPMRSQQTYMKSSPAANYARGVMMESTESIDYSADSAKDLKPPHSYAQLIGMAILSTNEQQMTLNNIYKWIMANYAFYRFNTGGWQNSIRHNLSLNKAFTKIARRTDEPGKGMKWMIEPTEFDTFVQQGMKGCRRPAPLPATQSTLGSPMSPIHAVRSGLNGARAEEDVTPPLHAYQPLYPTANQAYTPDRGSKRPLDTNVGLGINGDGGDYEYLPRSTPRNGLTAAANAAGSPPALYVNDDPRVGPLNTPFPLRPSQRLAPPSTLKRPSDFIQFSSPAPFWKMEGLVGSTPFKPYDFSPIKTPFSGFKKAEDGTQQNGEANGEEGQSGTVQHENGIGSPVVRSSSPPILNQASDTRDSSPTLSRPATAVAKTLSQMANSQTDEVTSQLADELAPVPSESTTRNESMPPVSANSTSTIAHSVQMPSLEPTPRMNGFSASQPMMNGYHHLQESGMPTNGSSYTHTSAPMNGYGALDDGEDEGIDLAKGFQPIGAYHQRNHVAVGMGAPAFGR
ncbi:transcription factor [Elasticomyces elasticus]|nr:transcription factor [Elasticomyces elasticus]KAK4973912.1 transcription factor [Elasticomyces elasticus]